MCAKRLKYVEEAWKSKTNASNVLFNKGHYEAALGGYEEALSRAKVMNNYMEAALKMGIPSVQVFVISCNNIAFTYEKLSQIHDGACMLKRAIYFLLMRSKEPLFNKNEIQNELKRALILYLNYAERNAMEVGEAEKVFSDIRNELETNTAI